MTSQLLEQGFLYLLGNYNTINTMQEYIELLF